MANAPIPQVAIPEPTAHYSDLYEADLNYAAADAYQADHFNDANWIVLFSSIPPLVGSYIGPTKTFPY